LCGGSRILRFGRAYLLLAAVHIPSLLLAAGERADFLVVEHPHRLLLYNQYQQQLSSQEQAQLIPFAPIKLLNSEDVLGDGFTPCVRGELEGRIIYILKEKSGALTGAERAGDIRTFKNTTIVGDTIEVLRSGRMFVSDPRQKESSLRAGTRLVRIFRHDGVTYVKSLDGRQVFGWTTLDDLVEGRDWAVTRKSGPTRNEQLEKIFPGVMLKVNEVNAKFAQLFKHFNTTTSQQHPPPRWRVEHSGGALAIILDADVAAETFSQTSQVLGKSIETLLLGTDLRVSSSPREVEIH
jgi:hypothetical protein